MKKVLLVTDGILHPPLFGRLTLHQALAHVDGFSFSHVSSLEKLPADLSSFAALVLYYHHKKISDSALKRLDGFVGCGGGILAIHAVTASFLEARSYFKILGGRFIGHGKVERFKVERVKREIFEDLPDFIVRDELYVHEVDPNIEVHFSVKHEGTDVPVVWVYRYGMGKVCYAVPGHTTATIKNPSYQAVLRRGLQWVCS